MKLVAIETPLHMLDFAWQCWRDSLSRGEYALMPAGVFTHYQPPGTQFTAALEAHLAWWGEATALVVYADLGVTDAMRVAMCAALAAGIPVECRSLRPDVSVDISL